MFRKTNGDARHEYVAILVAVYAGIAIMMLFGVALVVPAKLAEIYDSAWWYCLYLIYIPPLIAWAIKNADAVMVS
jgi:hypothetical protein